MPNFWMVRAGEGGYLIDEFERQSAVSIGWAEAGDLSILRSPEAIRQALQRGYPEAKPGTLNVWTGVVHKFRNVFQLGDRVISVRPRAPGVPARLNHGRLRVPPGQMEDAPNLRRVRWERRVSRDTLSVSTKNTLGSTVTIFEPGPDVPAGDRIGTPEIGCATRLARLAKNRASRRKRSSRSSVATRSAGRTSSSKTESSRCPIQTWRSWWPPCCGPWGSRLA